MESNGIRPPQVKTYRVHNTMGVPQTIKR